MKPKLLIKIFLTIALFVMVVGCGGSSPEPAPAPTEAGVAQVPVEAATPTPVEVTPQAPAAGFTPEAICRVPDIVGLDVSVAKGVLVAAGLQPVPDFRHDESVATNAIISQEPPAKTMLEPCEGYVDIVVSLGPAPVPTNTPPPTETPGPTETPAPPTETPTLTPVPPTATPTPDPRLFFDDFETGISSEWEISGENFVSSNGQFISNGFLEAYVGDNNWTNYSIEIKNFYVDEAHGGRVLVHRQNRENYLALRCTYRDSSGCTKLNWVKVIDGQEKVIPGTFFNIKRGGTIKIEIVGHNYNTISNGEQVIRFVDDTFTSGGIGLVYKHVFRADSIEVVDLSSIALQQLPDEEPTKTPDNLLFFDDFETGISSEWEISGENFVSSNGQLVSYNYLEASVGDHNWTNYSIEIKNFYVGEAHGGRVLVHRQNRENYLALRCTYKDSSGCSKFHWVKVVDGQEIAIPETVFRHEKGFTLKIELDGNTYKTMVNGEQVVRFIDSTFSHGGIGLIYKEVFMADSIEVTTLE